MVVSRKLFSCQQHLRLIRSCLEHFAKINAKTYSPNKFIYLLVSGVNVVIAKSWIEQMNVFVVRKSLK